MSAQKNIHQVAIRLGVDPFLCSFLLSAFFNADWDERWEQEFAHLMVPQVSFDGQMIFGAGLGLVIHSTCDQDPNRLFQYRKWKSRLKHAMSEMARICPERYSLFGEHDVFLDQGIWMCSEKPSDLVEKFLLDDLAHRGLDYLAISASAMSRIDMNLRVESLSP